MNKTIKTFLFSEERIAVSIYDCFQVSS